MKNLILVCRKRSILVEKNSNGTINLFEEDRKPLQLAGQFINSAGGIDAILNRSIEYKGTFEEHLKERYKMRLQHKEDRENAKKIRLVKEQQQKIMFNAKMEKIIANGIIETTVENLALVLRFLNSQNWGTWKLPQMSIGYTAHQYDCDGVQATTIKLNKPISSAKHEITNESMFKVGGKRGHLNKYKSIWNYEI